MTPKQQPFFVGLIAFALLTPAIPYLHNTQSPLDISLPPPETLDTILEQSICQRMSYRSYTATSVTDQELSTILWAAYGYLDNGNRTIYHPTNAYSTVIYVIRSDATYIYVPENNSLHLFKTGNYLYLGQSTGAPIKLGMCWDKNVNSNEKDGMAEIGMTAQNVYFDANALGLAALTTGSSVNDLYDLGIPSNQKPEIIMHVGHPQPLYNFDYDPLPASNLPAVVNNTMTLAEATNNRHLITSWSDTPLTTLEESQTLWASYGNSYLLDNNNHRHHRTLPSAVDIYPFFVYAANQTAVYLYNPAVHSVSTILEGDHRSDIATAIGSTNLSVATAPWIILAFYDSTHNPQYMTWWYYESGAIMHNVLLEAGALNLSANIGFNIADPAGLRTALGIASHTSYTPEAFACVGTPTLPQNQPPLAPTLNGTASGNAKTQYNFTISTVDPENDNVSYYLSWGDGTNTGWQSFVASGQPMTFAHSWAKKGTYTVSGKAKDVFGAESPVTTLKVIMPLTFNIPPGSFWYWLFQHFPNAFALLQKILNH